MSNPFRSFVFVLVAVALGGLTGAASSPASTGTPGPVPEAVASTEDALASKTFDSTGTGATASRRKRPKFMPMYKAKNNARYAAYQIYLDPEFNFDQYGVGKCRRSNRSVVYCYTWASEDYYDELGYYIDTMLCDWFTTSSYNGRGKMKMKIEQPDCVWISEI